MMKICKHFQNRRACSAFLESNPKDNKKGDMNWNLVQVIKPSNSQYSQQRDWVYVVNRSQLTKPGFSYFDQSNTTDFQINISVLQALFSNNN